MIRRYIYIESGTSGVNCNTFGLFEWKYNEQEALRQRTLIAEHELCGNNKLVTRMGLDEWFRKNTYIVRYPIAWRYFV